jgi:hypothetical protein
MLRTMQNQKNKQTNEKKKKRQSAHFTALFLPFAWSCRGGRKVGGGSGRDVDRAKPMGRRAVPRVVAGWLSARV